MPSFQDILGQDTIKKQIGSMLRSKQIPHALIIEGEKLSGKKMLAGIFAAALQCEAEDGKPCGVCHACIQSFADSNPDIIWVKHEKPNLISVKEIREQVVGTVDIKPYSGPYKIYIIADAEKMNPEAQNAILKTLEEPPTYVVMILLTANAEALLQTVLSRCTRIQMLPVRDDLVRKYLMEQVEIPDYKADLCIAFARGNPGKAKQLAVSEEFDTLRKEIMSVVRNIEDMEFTDIMDCVKRAGSYQANFEEYLDLLMLWYRDVMVYKASENASRLIFKEELQYISTVAKNCSFEGLKKVTEVIAATRAKYRANVNFELLTELLFLDIKESQGE